jgi:fatty acid-binding protein DegV
VLEARDGRVEPVTRVRSFGKAHAALKEYVDTRAPNGVETWAILHANAPEHRDRVRQEITENLDTDGQSFDDIAIGPVLGTHAGPGAFGIAFVARP